MDWVGWVGYLPGAILRAPDGANNYMYLVVPLRHHPNLHYAD